MRPPFGKAGDRWGDMLYDMLPTIAIGALIGIAITLLLSSCCATPRPRVVTVTPPPCLATLAPVVPEGVAPFTPAWAAVYVETMAWIEATQRACGSHLLNVDRGETAPEEEGSW